ncbi:hypothetical protein MTBSS4_150004 [Magnetospirillum sp. SS-4]|nr:hypothetical protein MTBSS4_150004 [Magnetospirillum sp. SS-4]
MGLEHHICARDRQCYQSAAPSARLLSTNRSATIVPSLRLGAHVRHRCASPAFSGTVVPRQRLAAFWANLSTFLRRLIGCGVVSQTCLGTLRRAS